MFQKDFLAANGYYNTTIEFLKEITYKTVGKKYPSVDVDREKLKVEIEESHKKWTSENQYEWCECHICGYRATEIPNHVTKHGISCADYKKQFNASVKSQKNSDRVKGSNNPAYGHGGKFSPYSKDFVGYEGLSDSEKEIKISETYDKKSKTVEENPQNNPKRVEYWLHRGYGMNEAKELLSNSQSTFSKEKCIENHGETEGLRIWKERQDKWIESYNDKTADEMNEINRKKSTGLRYKTILKEGVNYDGWFYIIELEDNLVKIGITSKDSIGKRYTKQIEREKTTTFVQMKNMLHAYKTEQVMKTLLSDAKISQCDQQGVFGWTEVFRCKYSRVTKLFKAINENADLDVAFGKIYKGENRDDAI